MTTTLERMRALSARGRMLVAGLAVAALLAIAVVAWLSRDVAVPLFPEPLRPEQTSEVVERLAAWNVPFEPRADNVRVDPHRRNALLLRLSLAGVPHEPIATSSDALAKAGPLTPQAVLDAEQREGLAGDLALALRGVAGIDDARIILADEHPAPFGDESSHPATASVRLTLRPGFVPSREQLSAVRTFVAAAVPGLDSHRVALLDDRGVALGEAGVSADQGDALTASLQSALDEAFGSAATIVRVHVVYDSRAHEVHDSSRRPAGLHAILSTRSEERYTSEKKHYAKSNVSEDRGSLLHDERTAVEPGATQRVSVAVLVDSERKLDLIQVRSIAEATVGIEPERGDTVSVQNVTFRHPLPSPSPEVFALGYLGTLGPALVLAAGLVGLGIAIRPALRYASATSAHATLRSIAAQATVAPEDVRRFLNGEPPHAVAAVLSGLPAPIVTAVLDGYDQSERTAIVDCMSRPLAPVVRNVHAFAAAPTS